MWPGDIIWQHTLQWRYNGRDGVSNHQPRYCLLKRLFRRRSEKISKLRVTSLCARNSPVTGEFPAQMARNAEYISIWWRLHDRFGSIVVAVACNCLATPNHYLDQYYLLPKIFSGIQLWAIPQEVPIKLTRNILLGNYTFKITTTSLKG